MNIDILCMKSATSARECQSVALKLKYNRVGGTPPGFFDSFIIMNIVHFKKSLTIAEVTKQD